MSAPEPALIALTGPTASGKTALALTLAEAFDGEIISCDSVAVYRRLDIGSAKPSPAERARIRHHALDLFWPNEPCTAGDYARRARGAIADVHARGRLPIIAGGTGLYLRALLEGLAPAPPRNEALRSRLRDRAASRPAGHLHRLLQRLDARAADAIHPNDTPKLIRSLEVTLSAHRPQSEQWTEGRDPLTGFRILHLGLDPAREALYNRINTRAAAMFDRGLIEETAAIRTDFGPDCRPLTSLGYKQAADVLTGMATLPEAIAAAQQGHRNYAKRQVTWFRAQFREQSGAHAATHWLHGFGDDPLFQAQALQRTRTHIAG